MIKWEDLNAKEQSVVEAVLYGDFESEMGHEASTQEKIRHYLFEYGCYSDEFGSELKIAEYINGKEEKKREEAQEIISKELEEAFNSEEGITDLNIFYDRLAEMGFSEENGAVEMIDEAVFRATGR